MTDGEIAELKYDKKTIAESPELRSLFRNRLEQLVTRIFDETTPFDQPADLDKCTFCQFQSMCNRQAPADRQ